MANIDLTNTVELSIRMRENLAGGFELQLDPGGPDLNGASGSLVITKDTFSQTLNISNGGITITGPDKFALSLPALPRGIYDYTFELIPVSGEAIRIVDEIEVIK